MPTSESYFSQCNCCLSPRGTDLSLTFKNSKVTYLINPIIHLYIWEDKPECGMLILGWVDWKCYELIKVSSPMKRLGEEVAKVGGRALKEKVSNKKNIIYFTVLSWTHDLRNYTFGALVIKRSAHWLLSIFGSFVSRSISRHVFTESSLGRLNVYTTYQEVFWA